MADIRISSNSTLRMRCSDRGAPRENRLAKAVCDPAPVSHPASGRTPVVYKKCLQLLFGKKECFCVES